MKAFRKVAIGTDAITRAIAFAISQPANVDTSEIVIRPTASALRGCSLRRDCY